MKTITSPPSLWSALPATKLPTHENSSDAIHVSHINIRESISFMILKLILIQFITFILVMLFDTLLKDFAILHIILTSVFMTIQLILSLIVILQWLNEYYEITPDRLIHKRGIIFKKLEEYVFSHLMSIDFHQTFLGSLLNYGTIHLYDRYINKDIQMYLIHNPKRYFYILKELVPYTDSASETVREHFVETNELDDETELQEVDDEA